MPRDVIPAAKPWQVGETTWMARRLSPMALQEMVNVLRAKTPDPKLEAKKLIEGLPPEVAKHVWDSAMRDAPPWPPTLDSEAGKAALCSRDGMACVIYHALRKSHGNFTREQAAELADRIDFDEFGDLLAIVMPAGDDDGEGAAEARPTAAPATTPGPESGPESGSGPPTSPSATNSA